MLLFFALSTTQLLAQSEPPKINLKLEKGIAMQEGGMIAKLVGVGLVAGAVVLSQKEFDNTATIQDFDKNRTIVKSMGIGGGSIFLFGFALDFSGRRKAFRLLR